MTVEGLTAAGVTAQIAAAVTAGNVKLTGDTVQVVNTQTSAVATGTAIIPVDDTIPQITEGTEVMTATITPTNASNRLRIDVTASFSHSITNQWLVAALFQDAGVNAIGSAIQFQSAGLAMMTVNFTYFMTAGTTSATTFRVRCGGQSAGTMTFNGASGARLYGGALSSSITVSEIKA